MVEKRRREKQKKQTKSPGGNKAKGEMETASGDTVKAFHSYTTSAVSAEETSPPASPTSPEPKKGKAALTLEEVHESIIKTMNECTDSLLSRIDKNAKSIRDVDEKLQNVFADIENIKETVETVTQCTSEHEKCIKELEAKLNAVESHHRRWNLRLYGVTEERGGRLKNQVIDICRKVAPETSGTLVLYVDVCHRLGVREDGKTRPVIIRFISRDTAEKIGKAAPKSDFLKTRKLWIKEDLTPRDIESRNFFWPQINAARQEGKRAYFVGGRAFIEGKELKR